MDWLGKQARGGEGNASTESSLSDRWLSGLIPQELVEEHPRTRDRAFLLMRYSLVAAVFTLLFSPYFVFSLKLPYAGPLNILYLSSLALTPVLLRKTRSVRIAANWILATALSILLFQSSVLGGVSSLAYPWLCCLPVAAMLLRGLRGGALWTLVCCAGVVGLGVADGMGALPNLPVSGGPPRSATMVTIASLTVALGALAWLAESRADRLLQDLQRQKQMYQERSVRDWLTGLANRSLLTECLIQSWERARRHGPRGALFFIDLNDFKLVNDEHGHAAGDNVLREVALRLQDTVRSSDLVGRIGGDELGLIIEGVESQSDVAVLADKIAEAIEEPIAVAGTEIRIGASIGVAFFPDHDCHFDERVTYPGVSANSNIGRGEVDHESVERLLEKADTAMYTAKRRALRYWIHEHVADETRRSPTALVSEPPPAA